MKLAQRISVVFEYCTGSTFTCHKTKPNQTKQKRIYLIYMYKTDFTLNDVLRMICHKTKSGLIERELFLLFVVGRSDLVEYNYQPD